jgi:hypothetical protein
MRRRLAFRDDDSTLLNEAASSDRQAQPEIGASGGTAAADRGHWREKKPGELRRVNRGTAFAEDRKAVATPKTPHDRWPDDRIAADADRGQ